MDVTKQLGRCRLLLMSVVMCLAAAGSREIDLMALMRHLHRDRGSEVRVTSVATLVPVWVFRLVGRKVIVSPLSDLGLTTIRGAFGLAVLFRWFMIPDIMLVIGVCIRLAALLVAIKAVMILLVRMVLLGCMASLAIIFVIFAFILMKLLAGMTTFGFWMALGVRLRKAYIIFVRMTSVTVMRVI